MSGLQNDLKQMSAVLLVSLWAFSWLSGVAAQSLQKHVLHASSSFPPGDTAFPLLSCHPSTCRKRDLLAKERLLAAVLVSALVLHW